MEHYFVAYASIICHTYVAKAPIDMASAWHHAHRHSDTTSVSTSRKTSHGCLCSTTTRFHWRTSWGYHECQNLMRDQSWLFLQYHNIFSLVRELGVPNPFTDWTTSGFWSPQGLTTEAPVFSKQQQYPTLLGQFIHTFPLFRYAFVKPTVVNTHPSKAAAIPTLLGQFIHTFPLFRYAYMQPIVPGSQLLTTCIPAKPQQHPTLLEQFIHTFPFFWYALHAFVPHHHALKLTCCFNMHPEVATAVS